MPRTWYGMPAPRSGNRRGRFVRHAQQFGERYMTRGYHGVASLDAAVQWPLYCALTELTAAEEANLATLVKKAVS